MSDLPGAILRIDLSNGGHVDLACADDGQAHYFSAEVKAMCGSSAVPAGPGPGPGMSMAELQRWIAARTCTGCGKVTVGAATGRSG